MAFEIYQNSPKHGNKQEFYLKLIWFVCRSRWTNPCNHRLVTQTFFRQACQFHGTTVEFQAPLYEIRIPIPHCRHRHRSRSCHHIFHYQIHLQFHRIRRPEDASIKIAVDHLFHQSYTPSSAEVRRIYWEHSELFWLLRALILCSFGKWALLSAAILISMCWRPTWNSKKKGQLLPRCCPHRCSDWDPKSIGEPKKADGWDMRMRSLSDVANCARYVYSPVCVKCEVSKIWADIEDCQYIDRGI